MGSLTDLAERVKELLNDAFKPAEISVSSRDGVVVILVTERFEGLEDMARQEAVWQVLDRSLTPEERRAIAVVVALTPKEHGFHLAGHPA
jgi:acid stress-induced BolA-like protein IbaG/YrbA